MADSRHITRRTFLHHAAATSAAATFATAAPAEASAELDELIADYRWKLEEWGHLQEVFDGAGFEFRRVNSSPSVHWYESIALHEPEMIDAWTRNVCDPEIMGPEIAGMRSAERDALKAELVELKSAYRRAEEAAGLPQLEAAAEAAWDAKEEAWRAILTYRPANMDQVTTKSAFLLDKLRAGLPISEDEIELVLGAQTPPTHEPSERARA